MAWFAQPLFEKMLLPLALYGAVWTALNLITGGSSILAHRIEKKLGESMTLKIMAVLIPVLMIISGIIPSFAIIPLLAVFYFLRGIATPVTNSDVVATGIRCFSFAPLAGWITDNYSLGAGLAISGGFILAMSLGTLILFLSYRNSKGKKVS
jgi:hypothetical protein